METLLQFSDPHRRTSQVETISFANKKPQSIRINKGNDADEEEPK